MSKNMNRRQFLGVAAGTAAAGLIGCAPLGKVGKAGAQNKTGLPHRVLGRTGCSVSILAFGGGSALSAVKSDDDAVRLIRHAFDSGITYFDTAHEYGGGKSELRYGMALKDKRKEVFFSTKYEPDRTKDETLFDIEESLRRLQTDYIDLAQVHAVHTIELAERMAAKGGCLEAILEMQSQGVIRFVGITSHLNAHSAKRALELYDFDTLLCALNATGKTYAFPDERRQAPRDGFEEVVFPIAKKRKMGISGIKIMGQRRLLGEGPGKAKPADLLRYTLSLPITAAVVGMSRFSDVDENTRVAREFVPLTDEEKKRLQRQVAPSASAAVLPYLNPSYVDDGHYDPFLDPNLA